MRNNLVVLSLVAAFTLMTSFAFAGAVATMHVSVPFDFYAGEQQLPAGEYIFEMGSSYLPTGGSVTVRTSGGAGIVMMLTRAGTEKNLDSNHLLFNKYGDKHFLSSVSIRGCKAGVKAQKLERELRAQIEKDRSVVRIAQK